MTVLGLTNFIAYVDTKIKGKDVTMRRQNLVCILHFVKISWLRPSKPAGWF